MIKKIPGVPKRNPEGRRADLSPGHVFLLHAMWTASKTFSALLPSNPTLDKLTNKR